MSRTVAQQAPRGSQAESVRGAEGETGECPVDAQGRCRRAHRYVMMSSAGHLKPGRPGENNRAARRLPTPRVLALLPRVISSRIFAGVDFEALAAKAVPLFHFSRVAQRVGGARMHIMQEDS